MLLYAVVFQSRNNGLRVRDGIKVLNNNLMVGSNEDDRREGADAILVVDASASACSCNGWILNTVCVDPVHASILVISIVDFHKENIVHVAAEQRIGLHHFGY